MARATRMDEMDVKLQIAAMGGKWKYFENNIGDMNRVINTDQGETTLHIATLARQEKFVKKLVKKLSPRDLETGNTLGNNALSYAAISGNVNIAKVMVEAGNGSLKYPRSTRPPLLMAASLSDHQMVRYLFEQTNVRDPNWTDDQREELFHTCIAIGLLDVALTMLEQNRGLATTRNRYGETALLVLARTPSAFTNECELQSAGLFRRFVHSCTNLILCGKSSRSQAHKLVEMLLESDEENQIITSEQVVQLLYAAAEEGNADFLVKLIRMDPNLVWSKNDEKGSIFHVAVRKRHEKIFNLLSELGTIKDLIANRTTRVGQNNMLHLAATLAPQEKLDSVCGAALQMQRELLWFKEVEKNVPPSYKYMKNSQGKTPREIFAETHQVLRESGEKWMKDTAKSSMLVATLIATVMFASALGVPGGFKQSGQPGAGKPVFLEEKNFIVLSMSVAVAMFSSSASMLMFLAILTSRYAETDFLRSVPFKLLIGLTSLFFSMTAMVVAFSTVFVLYDNELVYISAFLCYVPFIYILLMNSLFVDLIHSIRGPHFLFQPGKCLFD